MKCLQIVRGRNSESYSRNLAALDLVTLAERRNELILSFAISCFRSEHHRWWFVPHPPLPLNTRVAPPRFLVPYSKRDRDEKRPIITYTEMLNGLSDSQWKELKLPPPTEVAVRSNVQLSDLDQQYPAKVNEGADCDVVADGGVEVPSVYPIRVYSITLVPLRTLEMQIACPPNPEICFSPTKPG